MDLFDNFYNGKKILVTGDTGFKGSWLSTWLHELGAEVYGYALPPKTPNDNFVQSDLSKKIIHLDGDIRDGTKLTKFFLKAQPDIAFHMAAQALVLPSYQDPVETFQTNVMGTVNFFEAIRKVGSVKVAINVTSDKCYQNNEWVWGYRENDPMGGDDPYSASKGCSELVTNSYLKSFLASGECLIASARAGNVIGGGDWAEYRIIPDIFRSYFGDNQLLIRNPSATRPWQFVLEPIFGYLKLAQTLFEKGSQYSGGWNFGPNTSTNISVLEVMERIKLIIPQLNYSVEDSLNKPHEAKLLKLDISKALSQLEWKPLLDLDETIQYTVEGYLHDEEDVYSHRIHQIKNYAAKY